MKTENDRRAAGAGTPVSEAGVARPPFVTVLERRIDAAGAELKRLWPEGVEWDAVPAEQMGRWHRVLNVSFRRLCARQRLLNGGGGR